MKMNRFVLRLSLVLCINFSLTAQQAIDEKVAELLSKMTLEEKASILFSSSITVEQENKNRLMAVARIRLYLI